MWSPGVTVTSHCDSGRHLTSVAMINSTIMPLAADTDKTRRNRLENLHTVALTARGQVLERLFRLGDAEREIGHCPCLLLESARSLRQSAGTRPASDRSPIADMPARADSES